MKRFFFKSALLLATPMIAGAAPANREAQPTAITPNPEIEGLHTVTAFYTVDMLEASSVPLDYSTVVTLSVNGTPIANHSDAIIIDGGGFACDLDCGSSCGTAELNGASVALRCHEDNCDAAGCDCQCGIWISAEFPDIPLSAGDLVGIGVEPVAGAALDNDDSDNGVDAPYTGLPLGWNRSVLGVEVDEVTPGSFIVDVSGTVSYEALAGRYNLDTAVDLVVNGTVAATQLVPLVAEQSFDSGCFTAGCGNSCGVVNGISAFCDPYLWWDCGCGGGWIASFPPTPWMPEDEIVIILRPVPGALPELPGFEDDDEFDIGSTVAVGNAASASWQLDQNRPNPFNPRTTISFDLEQSGDTSVHVLDASGRLVRTLLDRSLTEGKWSVTWDGKSDSGGRAASGIYFYRLSTETGVETKRMTMLK